MSMSAKNYTMNNSAFKYSRKKMTMQAAVRYAITRKKQLERTIEKYVAGSARVLCHALRKHPCSPHYNLAQNM